jgi:amino acid transporter
LLGQRSRLRICLAGFIVLPAALAKAEMATAMPGSGGMYLYIDRAMGPLSGTVVGLGAWFSLVFKSAFALVGLGAYLLLFVPLPSGLVKGVALVLGVLLIVVNVVGVKQTGRLQAIIVSIVLIALGIFIATGLPTVDQTQYHPFFAQGASGILAAGEFIFVSYAGVTKIASVAEEVENPGRNIPIGIIGSILLMMVVYTLVVFVIVGVTPLDVIAHSYILMAVAAGQYLGRPGKIGMAIIAVLALMSMANAGILSSSRYPLAMSRDVLLPPALSETSDRFSTPIQAIVFTGAVLLILIAFVPVVQLEKLASAFQMLVFTLEDVALIAFRESDAEWYEPEFTAPGYPWAQLGGIIGGIVLLTRLGPLALGGAGAIIIGGAIWYWVYGRERADREGAALDAIRRPSGRYILDSTRALFEQETNRVLVAISPEMPSERERTYCGSPIPLRGGGTVR